MPKTTETMLDRLARTLKAREHALDRFDRRDQSLKRFWKQADPESEWYDGNADALAYAPKDVKDRRALLDKARREADELHYDLGDKAVMEFGRLMKSNPGLRVRRRALDMMPDELLDDYQY